jgi:hypothetical protein
MELWATTALHPPAQMFDARRAMLPPSNPMSQRFEKLYAEMKKIGGYPLAETTTLSMMGKNMVTATEATEVKKGAIPALAFEVPAGFKRVESPYKKFATGAK